LIELAELEIGRDVIGIVLFHKLEFANGVIVLAGLHIFESEGIPGEGVFLVVVKKAF
jgi:hypothetical protein